MQDFTLHLHDEAGTVALGAALSQTLVPGLKIYLHGDLGVGKTALTRTLLQAAGYTGHVKSPTYTLVEPYAVMLNQQAVELMHFDLYRMASPEEFLEAGFREHFNETNICIVEWPEKAENVLPTPDINITFSVSGEGRDVKLHGLTNKGSQCLARLKFAPNL
ncbi:MAG: tRNA (adenosine(37)-N6)-threonylcarbamoyltransferase complex ATPase subunit type 1 TsaE [Glaciimonas sp.]|nr:tRNA (adenosine(37)-N6)-threonylcarbamoyltransferase complex ATPase subunit type 1 TsaE [Glaciimonas sp.]